MKANDAVTGRSGLQEGDRASDNSLFAAYMSLGQLYYQAGKTDQAVKEYETVLAKDSTVIPAHMLLGIIHDLKKEHDKAQAHHKQALKLNPKFAPAANNLAWLMAEQDGNLDVALSYAQTAREQQPNDPHIADTLGSIYYKKNAYLLAVTLLKEAADKLPKDPVVQFHYGMAQYKNGNSAGAKKALQTSLNAQQRLLRIRRSPERRWLVYGGRSHKKGFTPVVRSLEGHSTASDF